MKLYDRTENDQACILTPDFRLISAIAEAKGKIKLLKTKEGLHVSLESLKVSSKARDDEFGEIMENLRHDLFFAQEKLSTKEGAFAKRKDAKE